VQGPGIGLDCAVLDFGSILLVLKSDPITFASDQIGWYLVQVNANDIATTGALPRWLLITALFPENATTPGIVESISDQVFKACKELDITIIGGHTEITHGISHPILVGTLIGEVGREKLITPKGAQPGDRVLLTKGVPIEATALLAREFSSRLNGVLTENEISEAQAFLHQPGISILHDAQIACQKGRVTAMHDPTEGGIVGACWELAEACGHSLNLDPSQIFIPSLSLRICNFFGLDPYRSIASGSLLLTVSPTDATNVCDALQHEGIRCSDIGFITDGPPVVNISNHPERYDFQRPDRDEITRMFS
jgi:hydrogenase maturation factor